jgi:short-subunit dehydrogenase
MLPRRGLSLDGSVVVVTGGSSGIGAATAVACARRGARVLAVARRADRLAEVVAACRAVGGPALAVPADVTTPDAARMIAAAADAEFGPVDVLVNNAGGGLHRPAGATTPAEVEALFAVHVLAPIRLTAAVLPGMLERGRGSIVNVTSISAFIPAPEEAVYGAAKAALSRWSHGLATELAGTGVRVAAVSPGPIDTEIWDHVGRDYAGRLFPAALVAAAVVDAVERGRTQVTVPRRYGVPAALYPLAGAAVRLGVRRFARGRRAAVG